MTLSIAIVVLPEILMQAGVGSRLQHTMQVDEKVEYQIVTLQDAAEQLEAGSAFISLLDVGTATTANMDESQHDAIKKVLLRSSSLLWVSQPNQDHAVPALGVSDGLSRTVCTENPSIKLVALKIEQTDKLESVVAAIEKTYKVSLSCESTEGYEREYRFNQDRIHIPRLVDDRPTDHRVSIPSNNHHQALQQLHRCPALELQVQISGDLDSVRCVQDNSSSERLQEREVEVEVKAIGVSNLDLMFATGNAAATRSMGSEHAGIVRRAGEASAFRPGDRIAVACTEGIKTYASVPDHCAALLPDCIAVHEAALLPVGASTAWHSLHNVARTQPGESVLIHTAAGSVGQAAIQIAQDKDGEISATVGSDSKRKFLTETYGIHDDHIASSRDTSFVQAIRKVTNGRGVDVILNTLPGDRQLASLERLAPHGRFVELGRGAISAYAESSVHALRKNSSFSVVDMPWSPTSSPKLLKATLEAIIAKVRDGKLRPAQPLRRYGSRRRQQSLQRYPKGG